MTNVTAFHPSRDGKIPMPTPSGEAKILFFTGVRYVRESELEALAQPAAGPRPKNDDPHGRTERRLA
jgi:hypothetical protein